MQVSKVCVYLIMENGNFTLTEKQVLFIHKFAFDNMLNASVSDTDIYFNGGKNHEGMQILIDNGSYEVIQYMAGKNEDELHVYTETNSLIIALKSLIKGNMLGKRKPIKIWDNDTAIAGAKIKGIHF